MGVFFLRLAQALGPAPQVSLPAPQEQALTRSAKSADGHVRKNGRLGRALFWGYRVVALQKSCHENGSHSHLAGTIINCATAAALVDG